MTGRLGETRARRKGETGETGEPAVLREPETAFGEESGYPRGYGVTGRDVRNGELPAADLHLRGAPCAGARFGQRGRNETVAPSRGERHSEEDPCGAGGGGDGSGF